MPAPGVAAADTLQGHPPAFERAIFFDGFGSISAAGGCVPAFGTEERRDRALVYADDAEKYEREESFHGTNVGRIKAFFSVVRSPVVPNLQPA